MTEAAHMHLRAGTRSSRLARVQTRNALDRLEAQFPGLTFEDVPLSSPGDRDLETHLNESPADFFTRDLDDGVLNGDVDCAVHSAKDMPDPVREGLDWFWLPWREDPRDAILLAPGRKLAELPPDAVIGVSSDRREAYGRRRFPGARQRGIRGSIEERIQQLDAGDFDVVIMASAALIRLGLQDRITEWIPLDVLPPPDGQGYLSLTFRAGDERFVRMRSLFAKAVTFAGGGVGSSGTCTLEVLNAVRHCEVCLHDALMGQEVLDRLPPGAECIHVGKRCGRHSLPQPEITELIARHARRGRRVLRLKGGDPGIFGRLAEEVDALDALSLPYRVLPGVSSLAAATTGTGMLLTRRGLTRGFCVMTPRLAGGGLGSVSAAERAGLPIVFYMAVSVTAKIAAELVGEGWDAETPAAIVFGAGGDQACTVSGTLADIGEKVGQRPEEMPGTLIVGEVARFRYRSDSGALQGRRVLLTASRALQDKAAVLVADFGGIPVCRPLIRLAATSEALGHVRQIDSYDWIVLTSPSAVRCFGELLEEGAVDRRRVPTLVSCGGGTSAELVELGLKADIEPPADFGAAGLLDTLRKSVTGQTRVLRLRSDKAGPALADALRACGATVDDCILYRNEAVEHAGCPEFDVAFFASASAVEVFDRLWGVASLTGRTVLAIGKPTVAALEKRGVATDLTGPEATVESSLTALAAQSVRETLLST